MEVDKIRDLKNELDFNLSKLISDFENETGMQISSVVIKRKVSTDEHTIGVRTFALID